MASLMFLVGSAVFLVMGLVRSFQGGKPMALVWVGLALLAVGLVLGWRARKAQRPASGH